MEKLNTPYLTLFALASFVSLAYYSTQEHGYNRKEIAAMRGLVASALAPQTDAQKMTYLFGATD